MDILVIKLVKMLNVNGPKIKDGENGTINMVNGLIVGELYLVMLEYLKIDELKLLTWTNGIIGEYL